MTRIPIDPNGYTVNVSTGTIHTRYAGIHAGESYRTRTTKGVLHLLNGDEGQACSICYPSPQYPAGPESKPPQVRRTTPVPNKAKPKKAT
jgi:hypothetical protein